MGKVLGNGRRNDEGGHLDVNLDCSPPTKAHAGTRTRDRLLGTDRAEVQFSYHICIGAAAFGEAKKQPTALVSASPG